MNLCRVCEWRRATHRGLCFTCYQYRRRNGFDRPEDQVIAPGRRLSSRPGSRSPYPYRIRWDWDGEPERALSARAYKNADTALEIAEGASKDYRSLTAYVVNARTLQLVAVFRRGRDVSDPRATLLGMTGL